MLKKIREETAREAVFEKHRDIVEQRINESREKILTKVIPGFFSIPEHLKQMFRHLTDVEEELRPTWRESLTSWSFSSSDVTLRATTKTRSRTLTTSLRLNTAATRPGSGST